MFLAIIPPSAAKGNQMTSSDIRETSKVTNVRIFVEKAIAITSPIKRRVNEVIIL